MNFGLFDMNKMELLHKGIGYMFLILLCFGIRIRNPGMKLLMKDQKSNVTRKYLTMSALVKSFDLSSAQNDK